MSYQFGSYVIEAEPRGRYAFGACPLCSADGKTLGVDAAHDFFHCLACKASGTFAMLAERLEQQEGGAADE